MNIELSLEAILLALAKYGAPSLVRHSKGWYCRLAVFVTGAGAKLEISSDFKMHAPTTAALQCAQRLADAFSRMDTQFSDRTSFTQYVEALSGTAQSTQV